MQRGQLGKRILVLRPEWDKALARVATLCDMSGCECCEKKARESFLLLEAEQQLRYWWDSQHSCPCGARAESLSSHPHVLGCPTERAVARLQECL